MSVICAVIVMFICCVILKCCEKAVLSEDVAGVCSGLHRNVAVVRRKSSHTIGM